MDILEKIVLEKQKEVAERKRMTPLSSLTQKPEFKEASRSLRRALQCQGSSGIISEFKRRSPSLGWISEHADAAKITRGYTEAGAAGISCLTDEPFFGGTLADFATVRRANYETPILRKDFMIDEYQVFEAKSMGADVILLIAECLDKHTIKHLSMIAYDLGLEVLLEMHSAEELDKICDTIDLVGVNNRNLKTFSVSIQTSIDLSAQIPSKFVKVAESGIAKPETLPLLRGYGFEGFLIGEAFMKTTDPANALKNFITAAIQ